MCRRLIKEVLDPEKQIEPPGFLVDRVEGLELADEVKLDILLLYQRRVHAFCLYCAEEYEDERMLATCCGPQHVRSHQNIPEEELSEILAKAAKKVIADEGDKENAPMKGNLLKENISNEKEDPEKDEFHVHLELLSQLEAEKPSNKEGLADEASSEQKWSGSVLFLKKYVSSALLRLEEKARKWTDPAQEFITQDIEDFCRYKCKEIEPGQKYKCQICSKHFRGEDFVVKHIKNKHAEAIDETYEKESTKEWLNKTI